MKYIWKLKTCIEFQKQDVIIGPSHHSFTFDFDTFLRYFLCNITLLRIATYGKIKKNKLEIVVWKQPVREADRHWASGLYLLVLNRLNLHLQLELNYTTQYFEGSREIWRVPITADQARISKFTKIWKKKKKKGMNNERKEKKKKNWTSKF